MILGMIRRNINLLQARGIEVTLRWIPAHTGVKGNEEVDLMAKMATGWTPKRGNGQQAVRSTLPWIPQLLSACKRQINQGIRAWRERIWGKGDTGYTYKRRFPSPDRKVNNLYLLLTKAQSSALIQIRTEKIGLNGYLFRIKRAESP